MPSNVVIQSPPSHHPARTRGFTLIEALVIITIIGVLAAVIAPRLLSRIGEAKTAVAKQRMSVIEQQVNLFLYDHERLPNDLNELVVQPPDVDPGKWQAALKEKELLDPWGVPFQYQYPGDNGTFDLFTYGKDGQVGGEGDDTDVTNW